MRVSNRGTILSAAVRLVQREGVTAVTFDSVAAEAELTRGGIMYHFPSREALLAAIHQHLAAEWEATLVDAAGKSYDQATPDERLAAYARVCAQSSTRAELQLMLEAATHPEHNLPWKAVLDRWTTPIDAVDTDRGVLIRFIARLAADGLWMYESVFDQPLPPQTRERLAEHIAQMILQP
ncbi:TetR/AcrR family transcriptional regulator [Saccharomonospora sp. NPDC046836]|uniref:TetR/AcrR family transcriptional regulator n=1 Tax=Saccharomonospora sp. NPDC046836 TaxID=3156921 RepID=UPI0033D9F325